MRVLMIGVLFALVAMVGGGLSSARPEKEKPPEKKPEAAKPVEKLSLAEQLNKQVDYPGCHDPKTSLIEELDRLAKLYHLAFNVNEKAFKHEMLNDVLKTEIANPNPIPEMKASLKTVLRKVLSHIPVHSGATYLIRKDTIEITTNNFAQFEVNPPGNTAYNPLDDDRADHTLVIETFPLVSANIRKKPLVEALETLADENDVNIVLDPTVGEKKSQTPVTLRVKNLPADTAVLLLSQMADLHCVQIDNALFVSTTRKAAALKKLHALRRGKRSTEAEDEALLKKEEELTDRIGKKALESLEAPAKEPSPKK
jgi:hypothetical protein